MPKPCPFCGASLSPTRDGYAHPPSRVCYYGGAHIGKARVPSWDMRAATETVAFYDVVDGHPVFSETGKHGATVAQLNEMIGWYKERIQW